MIQLLSVFLSGNTNDSFDGLELFAARVEARQEEGLIGLKEGDDLLEWEDAEESSQRKFASLVLDSPAEAFEVIDLSTQVATSGTSSSSTLATQAPSSSTSIATSPASTSSTRNVTRGLSPSTQVATSPVSSSSWFNVSNRLSPGVTSLNMPLRSATFAEQAVISTDGWTDGKRRVVFWDREDAAEKRNAEEGQRLVERYDPINRAMAGWADAFIWPTQVEKALYEGDVFAAAPQQD